MGKKTGAILTKIYDWLFPPPAVECLVGETGQAPEPSRQGSLLFSFRAPLFVQQLLHENDPGGVQTFAFDVWVRIPDDHYAVLTPYMPGWTGGRILPMPRFLPPGWSGELSLTVFNSHPEEPAGLPANRPGFELLLAQTTGRVWISDKT